MKIDTGKAVVSLYNKKDNIILVDIYANGELGKIDVDDIHDAIENFDVQIPVDTICLKSGKNFLSDDAFQYSIEHSCLHNKVVYVITQMDDIHFPSQAQETYFKDHLVDFCSSVDDAYHMLKKGPNLL